MSGGLHVHDAETGLELYSFGNRKEVHKRFGNGFIRILNNIDGLVFRPDGSHLVSLSGSEEKGSVIQVWDFSSGKHLYDLENGKSEINEVVFSPRGKHIFGITRNDFGLADDNPIKVWDAKTGQMLRTLVGHSGQVECISPNRDGTRVVTCSPGREWSSLGRSEIKVWDVGTGNEIVATNIERPDYVGHHHDDRHIVSFGIGGSEIFYQAFEFGRQVTTTVLSVETGHQLAQTINMKPDYSSSSFFSRDGHRVVVSHHERGTRVCDTLSGHELLTLGDSQSRRWGNSSVCFSPDGKRIAAVTDHNTVTIWDSRRWTDEQRIARRAGLAIKDAWEVAATKADVAKLIRENSSIKEPVRKKALELLKAMRIEKKNDLDKRKPTTMILHPAKSS